MLNVHEEPTKNSAIIHVLNHSLRNLCDDKEGDIQDNFSVEDSKYGSFVASKNNKCLAPYRNKEVIKYFTIHIERLVFEAKCGRNNCYFYILVLSKQILVI